MRQFLGANLSPKFLNTGTTDATFWHSGTKDSFRHILKSSASLYESSDSQQNHHWNTIRTRCLPCDLCTHLVSYRKIIQFQISSRRENLVIKIRVLTKLFSNQFCSIRCRRKCLQSVNQRRHSRFTFVENTKVICQKSREPGFWEVMDSFAFLAYASLAASRILLQ